MSILSVKFLGLVIGAAVLVWFLPLRNRQIPVLLANLAFLGLLAPDWLSIIYVVVLALYTWLAGILMPRAKKPVLFIAVLIPVLGLLYFKYAGYLFDGVSLVMPLGLSFYTFKSISYLYDVNHKKSKAKGIVPVFDYITFFPAFLAGPIHRCESFFEELDKKFEFEYRDQKNGFIQLCFGLFQKFVIADELSYLVGQFLNPELTGMYTILGVILYAFHIYVDFDAYSNAAIGTARMMGIHLARNFHTPYLSSSIQEFWRRWHISLSSWLRDYVYIPLGGNRKGTFRRYLNVLIIFLVSGLWHGSTWMFVIWGLGHGLLNIIEGLYLSLFKGKKIKVLSLLGIPLNFVLVSILWVFFRSASVSEAVTILMNMTKTMPFKLSATEVTRNEFVWMAFLLLLVFVTDIMRYFRDMLDWLAKRPFILRWLVYIVMIVLAIIFGVYGPGYHPSDFIYVTF